VAHVAYIIAFSVPPRMGNPRVPLHWKRGIPFAICGFIVTSVLASKMIMAENPDKIMITAIYAYGTVLSIMGWRAAARIGYPVETLSSQVIAMIGAVFFIVSDCLLAFNRFHTAIAYAQIWVLSTYWIGQTAIAFSLQRMPWDQKLSYTVENL